MKVEMGKQVTVPDALTLSAELDGIAAMANCLAILIQDGGRAYDRAYDKPSEDILAEALYSINHHISRVSEDWLIYSEMLEESIKADIKARHEESTRQENSARPESSPAKQEGETA